MAASREKKMAVMFVLKIVCPPIKWCPINSHINIFFAVLAAAYRVVSY